MGDDREIRGSNSQGQRSFPGDGLSDSAINRELMAKAAFDPWTVFPLVPVIWAVVELLLVDWLFPAGFLGNLLAVIVILASGILIGGSFVHRKFLRHDEEYARALQEKLDRQDQERGEVSQTQLADLIQNLEDGFSEVDSEAGLKALDSLTYEYEQVGPAINRGRGADSLSISSIPALAEETYRQGLSVLSDALGLTRTIHLSNVDRLKAEIADLEREIERLRRGAQIERAEIREATVASYRERLELLSQQQLRVDQLFYQANRCEASIARARIELAALQAGGSETSVNAVTETLRRTITQAKDVQQELQRLGY